MALAAWLDVALGTLEELLEDLPEDNSPAGKTHECRTT